jgi:BirA family biotin operon repressor/biotin-[acetyl-CoA-carboxylase] ligase
MFTGMVGDRARYDDPRPPDVAAGDATRFSDVRWVAETGSTNADALALARDGAPEGIVIVADHQTAGRGRRSRTWVAPPGGSLLVSVLLRPRAPVADATTMAAALAMAEAVADTTGVDARLKWPNDLVVDDRKLAGVLAEADWPAGSAISAGYKQPPAHARAVVVVGIGLNVAWPAELPPELDEVADRATSLDRLCGDGPAGSDVAEARRRALLAAYLRRLDHRYGQLARGTDETVAALRAAWRDRSATLGRRVRVDLGTSDVEGTAVDVTGDGHLVVETAAGERRTLAVGDVVHLRPA